MNVLMRLILAMQMLPVITLMGPTHVPATMDIMEMEQTVLVSTFYLYLKDMKHMHAHSVRNDDIFIFIHISLKR